MSKVPLWCLNSSKRELPKVFNHEQLISVFEAIDNALVLMAAFIAFIAGLRISEVCKLKREHIDLKEKKIFIFQGKGGKDAVVDIVDDRFIPILERYLQIHKDNEYLFPGYVYGKSHICRATLLSNFTKAMKKAKILRFDYETVDGRRKNNFNFHTLRHTYCTYLIKKGLPLSYVQKLMRHSSIEMTQKYTHITDKDMREKIDEVFNRKSSSEQPVMIGQNLPNYDPAEVSPIQLLQFKLVNDEISIKEYQKKLKVILQETATSEKTLNIIP